MSGSVLSYRSIAPVENHLAHVHKMAEKLDEPKKSYDDLIEFLKLIPAEKFNKYAEITFDNPRFTILYAPVVESE